MKIMSAAFKNKGFIPSLYTCVGENINPDLAISEMPEYTRSLSLIIEDPDDATGNWVHWVVYNIPPEKKLIRANSIPGKQGINDFGRQNYGGPCPPRGTHHYHFKLYALDTELSFDSANINKRDLEKAQEGHILDKAELVALYER